MCPGALRNQPMARGEGPLVFLSPLYMSVSTSCRSPHPVVVRLRLKGLIRFVRRHLVVVGLLLLELVEVLWLLLGVAVESWLSRLASSHLFCGLLSARRPLSRGLAFGGLVWCLWWFCLVRLLLAVGLGWCVLSVRVSSCSGCACRVCCVAGRGAFRWLQII